MTLNEQQVVCMHEAKDALNRAREDEQALFMRGIYLVIFWGLIVLAIWPANPAASDFMALFAFVADALVYVGVSRKMYEPATEKALRQYASKCGDEDDFYAETMQMCVDYAHAATLVRDLTAARSRIIKLLAIIAAITLAVIAVGGRT